MVLWLVRSMRYHQYNGDDHGCPYNCKLVYYLNTIMPFTVVFHNGWWK